MNMDTSTPLCLFLAKVENRRETKRPQILCFKVTRCRVVDIKNIRERELLCVKAIVGISFTLRP